MGSKALIKAGAAVAALTIGLTVASAPNADAARQENWRHSGSSEVSSVSVYSGWVCNGTKDSVPRGTEADMDVRSVRIPAKTSLWWVTPRGQIRKKYNPSILSICWSYAGQGYTNGSYWAIRNGENWGNG